MGYYGNVAVFGIPISLATVVGLYLLLTGKALLG
jgi:hypothetical protein